jgi:hypothetical protein
VGREWWWIAYGPQVSPPLLRGLQVLGWETHCGC